MRYHEILTETRVLSSWIKDLSYHENYDSEYGDVGVLMTLLNKKQYFIPDVPRPLFSKWVRASSKGKFWHSSIKGYYT